MLQALKTFWKGEEGGEAVEWPLVVALVILGLIATWGLLGDAIVNILDRIILELNTAATAS
jgi:Flp pilus assembly pilin Flp